jgi:hypothetical protein
MKLHLPIIALFSSVLAVDNNNSNNEASLKKQPANSKASYMQIAWRSPPVKVTALRHQGYWPQASRRDLPTRVQVYDRGRTNSGLIDTFDDLRERSAMWVGDHDAMRELSSSLCGGEEAVWDFFWNKCLSFGCQAGRQELCRDRDGTDLFIKEFFRRYVFS